MSIDKSWTTIVNRNCDEFQQGLISFVERSKPYVNSRGQIRCPCRKCTNNLFWTIASMRQHIHIFGFCKRYITWKYHGEGTTPPVVDEVASSNQMADLITRGHDGDGNKEQPPSGGRLSSQHQMDGTTPPVVDEVASSNQMADIIAQGHDGDGNKEQPPSGGRLSSQHQIDGTTPPVVDEVASSNQMDDIIAQGHGGDGNKEQPPSGGRLSSQHQMDVVAPKRRGTAKNLGLTVAWEKNRKRPLPLEFDPTTGTTVGHIHDLLIREASSYIWRDICLDRESWEKISETEKNGLYRHLRLYFDIHDILENPEQLKFREGLEHQLSKRYRGRKTYAKTHFEKMGGYENVEGAKNNPPAGMNDDNWKKVVDFFTSEKHKKRSEVNKINRQKQTIKNLGGTSSYSSTCFKKQMSRVQSFREHHINKDGLFDDPVAEEQFNSLLRELAEMGQRSSLSSNPTPVDDEVSIFEKVLGARRGHIRGVGHKPSSRASSSQSHSEISRPSELDAARRLLHDPNFQESLLDLIRRSIRKDNVGNDDIDEDDNDENDG